MSGTNIIPFPRGPHPSKYKYLVDEIYFMVFALGIHVRSGEPFSRETEALVQELSVLVNRVRCALAMEADVLRE